MLTCNFLMKINQLFYADISKLTADVIDSNKRKHKVSYLTLVSSLMSNEKQKRNTNPKEIESISFSRRTRV